MGRNIFQKTINWIKHEFAADYSSSQFDHYDKYIQGQYRCNPKEFMDHRIEVVSGLIYALDKIKKYRISQPVYHQEGEIKGHLIEDRIKILDVGVRDGWTIDFLDLLGYPNVRGVELLQEYVSYAQSKGRDVLPGDVHNLTFADNSFDFVFSRHTLEHCLDPIKVITQLLRVTSEGGAMYCSFPFVRKPQGKHTLAIANVRTLHKILEECPFCYEPIFIGKAKDTNVLPEGNEAIIFVIKKEKKKSV